MWQRNKNIFFWILISWREKLEKSNTDLRQISSNFTENGEQLIKLSERLSHSYKAAFEYGQKQAVAGKPDPVMNEQYESLRVVHDALTSRVDKTRANIDRVQLELGEEIQITKELIDKIKEFRQSLYSEETGYT